MSSRLCGKNPRRSPRCLLLLALVLLAGCPGEVGTVPETTPLADAAGSQHDADPFLLPPPPVAEDMRGPDHPEPPSPLTPDLAPPPDPLDPDLGIAPPKDLATSSADKGAAAPVWPSVARHPVVLLPQADAHVQSGTGATKSLGSEPQLWIDKDLGGTTTQAYLRFAIGNVAVARAVLRLYISNGSSNSFDVVLVPSTTWAESITWNSKPAVSSQVIASVAASADSTWVELDVTPHVVSQSVFSIALLPRSANGVGISSREAATHKPKLVLEVGASLLANAVQPEADTMVRSGTAAAQSYGKWTFLDVDGDADGTVKQAYLRFPVPALASFKRAILRLYLLDGSSNSATVHALPDHSWTDAITWNTRPTATGTKLASLGYTARGWVEIDVTPAVVPGSKLSLALLPNSGNGIRIASMEAAFYRPLLVLTRTGASCGDGRCDEGETCQTCAGDCGACPAGCLSGELFAVRGDLHTHTGYSDGAGTPSQAFAMARTNKLDFLFVTDHLAKLDGTEWTNCHNAAKASQVAGSFVASCGWENDLDSSTTPELGHANVFFATGLSAVPNSATQATWYSKLAACTSCVGQINHPASVGHPWVSYAYNQAAAKNLALNEFNGGDMTAVPFAARIGKFTTGLDKGWRLAPTWNSDTHSASWGASTVRTGFWVTALTRPALETAMRGRRSFASSDRDASLRVRSGRCGPGSDLAGASLEIIEVLATDPTDGFEEIVLVGRGNKTLRTFACGGQKVCAGTTTVPVTSTTYVFAYARQPDGQYLIASPIWLRP